LCNFCQFAHPNKMCPNEPCITPVIIVENNELKIVKCIESQKKKLCS
jgi:hypothetical protein